jgi:hypothetical protein
MNHICRLTTIAALLLVTAAGAVTEDRLLIVSVTANREAEFRRLDIPIYWKLTDAVFAPADEVASARLQAAGWPVSVLDRELAPGSYFLVYKAGPARYSLPGAELWRNSRLALVRMTEGEARQAKASGFAMSRLPEQPRQLPEPPAALDKWGASPPDTTVSRLVGAVSLDSLMATLHDLQGFRTRYTYSPRCDSAAFYIGRRFTDLGAVTSYDVYTAGAQRDSSYNVIATIPGQAHPESIVIACGHFDSYSDDHANAPGADDNATGTAALIEAARILAAVPFRWTIKLAAFSGEEQWMLGSGHWVDSVAVPQGLQIAAVFNLDMFGYTAYDTNLMYINTNYASRSLAVLAESTNTWFDIGLKIVNYLDEDCAGDNTPFWQRGFKAVFALEDSEYGIWNGSNPYYHTTRDTIGNLRMGQVLRGTQLAVACLATLAEPWSASSVTEHPPVDNPPDSGPATPGLRVFPSPFRTTARVAGHGLGGLEVYNASGQLVELAAGDRIGQSLPPGLYFVRSRLSCRVSTSALKLP